MSSAIYAAAEEPDRWPLFLQKLRTGVRSTVTAFIFDDMRAGHASVAASVDFDPKFARLYEEYFASRNAWAAKLGTKLRTGSVVTSQELLPDRDLIRTEYYNDFLRPQDARHLLGSMPVVQAHSFAQVSMVRPGRMGAFSERETSLMRQLMPHLQRAIRMHQRFSRLEEQGRLAAEALDRAPFGVVLMDRTGHALLVNRAASEILAAADGLSLKPDGLRAASHSESENLKKLVP